MDMRIILHNNLVTPRLLFSSMKTKFIDYKEGPAENLALSERELHPTDGHYLMKIKAIGINRAEIMHRLGRYPIVKEEDKYLGLEAAGEVINPETKYIRVKF